MERLEWMGRRLRTLRLIYRTTSTSSGTACPQGATFLNRLRRVDIPKGDSATETRPLGIPTVADRIAQEVVKRYLEPILEPIFHRDSYGYRPGRSAIDAVRTARQRCWRYDWTLDIDVKGYFDSIDWELLLKAVKRFFKRLLKGLQYVPRVLITDKLRSYGVAKRELLPGVEHRKSRYLNSRAENSHRPTRRRERQMQRFKSSLQAQRFLSAHAFIYGHFHPRRHRMAANRYRSSRAKAFKVWQQETCAQVVA